MSSEPKGTKLGELTCDIARARGSRERQRSKTKGQGLIDPEDVAVPQHIAESVSSFHASLGVSPRTGERDRRPKLGDYSTAPLTSVQFLNGPKRVFNSLTMRPLKCAKKNDTLYTKCLGLRKRIIISSERPKHPLEQLINMSQQNKSSLAWENMNMHVPQMLEDFVTLSAEGMWKHEAPDACDSRATRTEPKNQGEVEEVAEGSYSRDRDGSEICRGKRSNKRTQPATPAGRPTRET